MDNLQKEQYTILLVEDDEQIREVVADYFQGKEKRFVVDLAKTGTEGLQRIREREYDLLLLDVMLPGMSGFSLIRELRRRSKAPVIFLTAKVREEDRLLGYELGCDDYVCKPFSLAELYAKANAILRRVKGENENPDSEKRGREAAKERNQELICGKISVNVRTMDVRVSGEEKELSPREFDLLLALMEHPDWIFTREMLLDRAWGLDYEGTDRTVDNHVKKLRRSLGEAGGQIKTIFGKGYKISEH